MLVHNCLFVNGPDNGVIRNLSMPPGYVSMHDNKKKDSYVNWKDVKATDLLDKPKIITYEKRKLAFGYPSILCMYIFYTEGKFSLEDIEICCEVVCKLILLCRGVIK